MTIKYLKFLIFPLILAGCATSKTIVPPKPVPPPIVKAPKVFKCDFIPAKFEGRLPCYGNDCGENGAPIMTLLLGENLQVTKILYTEHGNVEEKGQWNIEDDCIITITYPNKKLPEYYEAKTGALVKLNAHKQEYEAFTDQYILLKK